MTSGLSGKSSRDQASRALRSVSPCVRSPTDTSQQVISQSVTSPQSSTHPQDPKFQLPGTGRKARGRFHMCARSAQKATEHPAEPGTARLASLGLCGSRARVVKRGQPWK